MVADPVIDIPGGLDAYPGFDQACEQALRGQTGGETARTDMSAPAKGCGALLGPVWIKAGRFREGLRVAIAGAPHHQDIRACGNGEPRMFNIGANISVEADNRRLDAQTLGHHCGEPFRRRILQVSHDVRVIKECADGIGDSNGCGVETIEEVAGDERACRLWDMAAIVEVVGNIHAFKIRCDFFDEGTAAALQ